jgi:AAA domain
MTSEPRATSSRSRSRPTYARLTVAGFKSHLQPSTIEMRGLTLLSGGNGSGKTSIMQPLLLLKQTLEWPYDPGPLLLDGPHISFSNFAELLSRKSSTGDEMTEFSIEYQDESGQFTKLAFRPGARGVELSEMRFRRGSGNETVSFRLGGRTRHLLEALPPEWSDRVTRDDALKLGVVRNRCFCEITEQVSPSVESRRIGPTSALKSLSMNMLHVPVIRRQAKRSYAATNVGGMYHGPFESNVASILHTLREDKSQVLRMIWQQLRDMELTWKVDTKRIADTRVAIQVGWLPASRQGGSRDLINLADAGSAVTHILPVLLSLLIARPGQLVYLEQPEVFISDDARLRLLGCALEAARRGVRVVIESHSTVMSEELLGLVQNPQDAALIRINNFVRDAKGYTTVSPLNL